MVAEPRSRRHDDDFDELRQRPGPSAGGIDPRGWCLANLFGQHTRVLSVDAAAAKLTVETPRAARGGLIYQTIFRIDAHRDLAKPTLVLDPGWFDGLTINTVEPDSVTWSQKDGRNTVALEPIAAGDHFVLRFQYQVNPTVLGHRTQNVVLADGESDLATLEHAQRIYP